MANPNDPLFEIDSKQILAKLHLAAQTQVTQGFVINTAIKNPQDKGDPQKPGNTEFDLTNKSGEYQVGIGVEFNYVVPVNLEEDKEYKNLDEKCKEDENSDNEGETVFENKKKLLEYVLKTKKYEILDSNEDKDAKEFWKIKDEALKEQFEAPKDEDKDKETSLTDKDADKEQPKKPEDKKPSALDQAIALLPKAYDAEYKHRLAKKEEDLKKQTALSFEQLKIYYTSFAGKEAATKIKQSDLAGFQIDMSGKLDSHKSAEKLIKDYKITPLDDKEIKKAEENHIKQHINGFISTIMCFVIGYTLEVETM